MWKQEGKGPSRDYIKIRLGQRGVVPFTHSYKLLSAGTFILPKYPVNSSSQPIPVALEL